MSSTKNSGNAGDEQAPSVCKAQNIGELAQRVDEIIVRLERLEAVDRSIVREIIGNDLPKLASGVNELRKTTPELASAVAEIIKHLGSHSTALEKIATRQDKHDESFSEISVRQDKQERALADVCSTLGSSLMKIGEQIAIESEVTRTSARIAVAVGSEICRQQIDTFREESMTRFDNVDAQIKDVCLMIEKLHVAVNEYIDQVKLIEPFIDQYRDDITEIKSLNKSIETHIGSTNKLIVQSFGLLQEKVNKQFKSLPDSVKAAIGNGFDEKISNAEVIINRLTKLAERNFETVKVFGETSEGAVVAVSNAITMIRGAQASFNALVSSSATKASEEIFNVADNYIRERLASFYRMIDESDLSVSLGQLQKGMDGAKELAVQLAASKKATENIVEHFDEALRVSEEASEQAIINIRNAKAEVETSFSSLINNVEKLNTPVSNIERKLSSVYSTASEISSELVKAMTGIVTEGMRKIVLQEMEGVRATELISEDIASKVIEKLANDIGA